MNVQFLHSETLDDRIMLKCSRSIEFVEVKKIVRVESLRAYCKLNIIDDNSIILSCPLKKIEEKLSSYPIFFRSHKSHLINLLYVKNYHTDKGIKMADGYYVPLALAMKTVFIKKMEELFLCPEKESEQVPLTSSSN